MEVGLSLNFTIVIAIVEGLTEFLPVVVWTPAI